LTDAGLVVRLERGAGEASHLPDALFETVAFADSADAVYAGADFVLKVQPPTVEEIDKIPEQALVIGHMQPHKDSERILRLRDRSLTSFAMELLPRISRAQSMDTLSSQAAVAGYFAAITGAGLAPRFFPMLTTAAGTIRPSTVLVIGAGVAGLQAIATARRLGALVEAYDVRAATQEQVESLGAKFLKTDFAAEASGGYARELTDDEKAQQQQMLADHIAKADVVISTASVPGRPAPRIITQAMVERMKHGAVIVDLAAEGGGNCEVSQPGETIEHAHVTVHAPLNVPSQLARDASEMYAKNLYNFLLLLVQEGELTVNWEDEILKQSAVTHNGAIVHESTRTWVEGDQ